MNIYDAIMKAADHIENNPKSFYYYSNDIPPALDCGTPGCAVGWVGHFLGHRGVILQTHKVMGLDFGGPLEGIYNFADRMDEVSDDRRWRDSAEQCAATLRRYAEKYHGDEKPKAATPPDWNTIARSPLIPDHVQSEEVA